jgi:hypothetical protein
LFENEFVDMDTVVSNKEASRPEEQRSPFVSPKKRRLDGSISKDEYK